MNNIIKKYTVIISNHLKLGHNCHNEDFQTVYALRNLVVCVCFVFFKKGNETH